MYVLQICRPQYFSSYSLWLLEKLENNKYCTLKLLFGFLLIFFQKCATRTAIVFRLVCILLFQFFVCSFLYTMCFSSQGIRSKFKEWGQQTLSVIEDGFACNRNLIPQWMSLRTISVLCGPHGCVLVPNLFAARTLCFKLFLSKLCVVRILRDSVEPRRSPGGRDGGGVYPPWVRPIIHLLFSLREVVTSGRSRGGGGWKLCSDLWSTEVFWAFQIIISSSYLRGLEIYFPATSCPVNLWGFQFFLILE